MHWHTLVLVPHGFPTRGAGRPAMSRGASGIPGSRSPPGRRGDDNSRSNTAQARSGSPPDSRST